MGIEFKTLDEQISILKSRGLCFTDEEYSKRLLMRSNYYDVVNGYSKLIQINTNKYLPNATFEELYAIYMYDKNLKSVFFRKIEKSEAFLRSCIAYIFAKNHQERYSYLNTNNFRNKYLEVGPLLSNLTKIITTNKRYQNNAIKHYSDKHDEVPIWVLVNFLDFGTLRTFYSLMLDEDKIEIANYINKHFHFEYSIDPRLIPSEIDSFLTNINDIRNIVAHDNRLLQYRLRKKAISNKTLLESYPQTNTDSVFYVYLTLRLFLAREQFKNFTNALKRRTNTLNKQLNSSDSESNIQVILSSIGFPIKWLEDSFDEIYPQSK
ncbi:Abi family protein [Enterococcus faecalis]|uniref:Abi family protein n=1 Tax=Enterococcus faecalis TaxID=1351 RepID=UPI000CF1FB8C|nr:Abi family protein [Enterococcus faecalis]PQE46366.1 abortive phage infection protein [Enterococcus faecalis]PQG57620.1 abortive phage infection protein [Enterococcus faecalis]